MHYLIHMFTFIFIRMSLVKDLVHSGEVIDLFVVHEDLEVVDFEEQQEETVVVPIEVVVVIELLQAPEEEAILVVSLCFLIL